MVTFTSTGNLPLVKEAKSEPRGCSPQNIPFSDSTCSLQRCPNRCIWRLTAALYWHKFTCSVPAVKASSNDHTAPGWHNPSAESVPVSWRLYSLHLISFTLRYLGKLLHQSTIVSPALWENKVGQQINLRKKKKKREIRSFFSPLSFSVSFWNRMLPALGRTPGFSIVLMGAWIVYKETLQAAYKMSARLNQRLCQSYSRSNWSSTPKAALSHPATDSNNRGQDFCAGKPVWPQ